MDVLPNELSQGCSGSEEPVRSPGTQPVRPFDLPRPQGLGWLSRLLERASGLSAMADIYRRLPPDLSGQDFVDAALAGLGIDWRIAAGDLAHIPATGPVVVVANHPYGGAEGLALMAALLQRRADARMLANELLTRLPGLAPLIFSIDVFRSGVNAGGLRQARRHLEAGGVLMMFPAGEVSRFRWRDRRVADPEWSETAAMLARRTGAAVVPVGIRGQAPMRSQIAGLLHPRLRTLLLGRDLLALRGQCLDMHVGKAIPQAEMARVPTNAQTAYLRIVTEALRTDVPPAEQPRPRPMQPVAAPVAPDRLREAVSGLPAECHLLRKDEFDLYCVPGAAMGPLMDEIGRLREMSFRLVHEGTGKPRDSDRFDASYRHLLLWHRPTSAIAGAYRLGFSAEIMQSNGVRGLYTHTLFDFDERLLRASGPAIELGRSFVSPDWQRSFHPLRLLWAGIAQIVEQHPEIRMLFGPVSVSAAYSSLGRQLIADALSRHRGDGELSPLVRPRNPLRRRTDESFQHDAVAGLADPQLLSRLLARVERGPGLPVLMRHYLDLEARFAGFNVDDDFGDALDGLVIVRIADIPARVLERFKAAARS